MGEDVTLLADYFAEIENRKKQGLKPKPIDDGAMVAECIQHITDNSSAIEPPVWISLSITHCLVPPAPRG